VPDHVNTSRSLALGSPEFYPDILNQVTLRTPGKMCNAVHIHTHTHLLQRKAFERPLNGLQEGLIAFLALCDNPIVGHASSERGL
jgi:hypothetical protein